MDLPFSLSKHDFFARKKGQKKGSLKALCPFSVLLPESLVLCRTSPLVASLIMRSPELRPVVVPST